MSVMREMDTPLWLHNKLSSGDKWSGDSIGTFLSPELCGNIKNCYDSLESQVKAKLLMSLLNVPNRMLEAATPQLQDILSLGEKDSDEWSRVLSKMMKDFPAQGTINTDVEDGSWQDAVKIISNLLIEPASANLRPRERLYMNPGTSTKITPVQHFKLSAKHKCVLDRNEVLAKGKELQEQKKREEAKRETLTDPNDVSIPQYRGQMTPVPTPAARKPALSVSYTLSMKMKKEVKMKILDMNEAPVAEGPMARKRKRLSVLADSGEVTPKGKNKAELDEPATPGYNPGGMPYDAHSDDLMRGMDADYALKYGGSNLSSFFNPAVDPYNLPPPTPKIDDSLYRGYPASASGLFMDPMSYYQPPSVVDPEVARSLKSVLEKSNRLGEPDKSTIISFLHGNRTNPQPEKGSVITVLLNSDVEEEEDKQSLVEILFEMNYDTGRWRRLKRQSAYNPQGNYDNL